MLKTTGGAIALGALIVFGANDIGAQDQTTQPQARMASGPNAEMIMAMRDRLELTEEQIAAFDQIRREAVELRSSHQAAIAEMRSRLRAGEIERSEMMAFMEDLRSSAPATAQQRRERIEAVLNETQLQTLSELRAERRGFMRGRASMRRGGRGGRGFRPRRRSGPGGAPGPMRPGARGRGLGTGMGPGAPGPARPGPVRSDGR